MSSLYFFIENRKLSKQDTYACFVDYKMAFDSAPRDLLWKKLLKAGINSNILTSIKAAAAAAAAATVVVVVYM